MYIVSACLCGVNCRYDGKSNPDDRVIKLLKEGKAIPVCPEQLGGLKTPRLPSEIQKCSAKDVLDGNGKILNNKGEDVTDEFINGALETLRIANASNCTKAILKSKSPSCGYKIVYDGSFKGVLIEGNGVTAQLLIDNGIDVKTEKDI